MERNGKYRITAVVLGLPVIPNTNIRTKFLFYSNSLFEYYSIRELPKGGILSLFEGKSGFKQGAQKTMCRGSNPEPLDHWLQLPCVLPPRLACPQDNTQDRFTKYDEPFPTHQCQTQGSSDEHYLVSC